MNILIVTDAWHPQINGVVRTLDATRYYLEQFGHTVHIAGPDITSWRTLNLPTYADIKLECFSASRLKKLVKTFNPDCIHIATEGPLGWTIRAICMDQRRPFTTSYHTRFPEYISERAPKIIAGVLRLIAYANIRRFHRPAAQTMVATMSLEKTLIKHGFRHLTRWSRGVDLQKFQLYGKDFDLFRNLPRPILLYAGRLAVEKNIPAFLALQTPGSKVVVGDGPLLDRLRRENPETLFTGKLEGEQLARCYAAADLFVFPSLTDTFGLVLLEAMAAGLRVAAYPVMGPVDILEPEKTRDFAVLHKNLQMAVDQALQLPDNPDAPRQFAETFTWEACTRQFEAHLTTPTPPAIKRLHRLRKLLWPVRHILSSQSGKQL